MAGSKEKNLRRSLAEFKFLYIQYLFWRSKYNLEFYFLLPRPVSSKVFILFFINCSLRNWRNQDLSKVKHGKWFHSPKNANFKLFIHTKCNYHEKEARTSIELCIMY